MRKFLIPIMLLVSVPAFAKLERGACKKIVKETCGQFKGDRKAMRACLKENKDKFPEECRERAKKFRKHKKEKREQRQQEQESED